eukprot:9341899-Pyramimonas_sp.AAC.1
MRPASTLAHLTAEERAEQLDADLAQFSSPHLLRPDAMNLVVKLIRHIHQTEKLEYHIMVSKMDTEECARIGKPSAAPGTKSPPRTSATSPN